MFRPFSGSYEQKTSGAITAVKQQLKLIKRGPVANIMVDRSSKSSFSYLPVAAEGQITGKIFFKDFWDFWDFFQDFFHDFSKIFGIFETFFLRFLRFFLRFLEISRFFSSYLPLVSKSLFVPFCNFVPPVFWALFLPLLRCFEYHISIWNYYLFI